MAEMITGRHLIDWGYPQGSWFGAAIIAANAAVASGDDPRAAIDAAMPPPAIPMRAAGAKSYFLNIRAEDANEVENIAMVENTMRELMRVPTIEAGSVMPDACPAGEICVGGVVAAKEAIHPGYHSADICCSMGISVLGNVDPKVVLDMGMASTHFGYGGRHDPIEVPHAIMERFGNPFLRQLEAAARRDFASQGDGNHFFFVGTLKSTGETALVTHHGSRGFGAALYKAGMAKADEYRRKLSPETPKGSAWIPSETTTGEAYWNALQVVGDWTQASHFAIHDLVAARLGIKVRDRWWNEHNFVFRRSDGLFYHAKGATPGWSDYALTLVPLNMAEPVLVTRGTNAANGLGFLPHGAGRNMSRTRYLRENPNTLFPEGIDARFFSGVADHSELPGAYKNAASVRAQIGEYGLATIVDEVMPYGSIMAGELEKFWLKTSPPLTDPLKE